MADLSTVAELLRLFYRLSGTTTSDDGLTENSEAADEVAYTCLNFGMQEAQRFMIGCGMTERWRKRNTAWTTWTGTDAADGGRYNTLPTDFLRLSGRPYDRMRSSLTEANGEKWGVEITDNEEFVRGNSYYLKNDQLWLTRNAAVPTTIYLDYQFKHPEMASGVTLNFPEDAMGLVAAYGVRKASMEGWFPSNPELAERNVMLWEKQARSVANRSRGQRKQTAPRVIGTRFFA